MSIRVMNLVFDAEHVTDLAEFTTLIALADEADDEGKCYPGRDRLARKSRIERRSTNRVTDRLVEAGALTVIERGGPSEYGRPNLYLLNLDWLRGIESDGIESDAATPDPASPPTPDAESPLTEGHPDPDDQHPDGGSLKVSSGSPNPISVVVFKKNNKHIGAAPTREPDRKVQRELERRGVHRTVAEKLAAKHGTGCMEYVARFDADLAAGETRSPGWLVSAIEEGWSFGTPATPESELLTRSAAVAHYNTLPEATRPAWDDVFHTFNTEKGVRWTVRK